MAFDPNTSPGTVPLAAADPAQVAEVNRVGLKLLRADAAAGRAAVPAAVRELRAEWIALDDLALARAAGTPFLLFVVDVDAALRPERRWRGSEVLRAVAAPAPSPPTVPDAPARAFARMVVHYAWYVSATAPAAAPLSLGLALPDCERLRRIGLEQVEALADGAEHWVRLRWADDAAAWAARLEAARRDDPAALWSSTLVGLQRLAGGLLRAAERRW